MGVVRRPCATTAPLGPRLAPVSAVRDRLPAPAGHAILRGSDASPLPVGVFLDSRHDPVEKDSRLDVI